MGFLVTIHYGNGRSKVESFSDGVNTAMGTIRDAIDNESPDFIVERIELERMTYPEWMDRGSD